MARSVETVESPLKIDLERKIRNVHRYYYRRYYYYSCSGDRLIPLSGVFNQLCM